MSMPLFVRKDLLLIGSGGRNSGKTLFACRLIERTSSQCAVVGFKVTVVHEPGEILVPSEPGILVHGTVPGSYCITEELRRNSDKDTSRLLASGARRVFWMQSTGDGLRDGAERFFELLPNETALVGESNSLRLYVEPGVFLLIRAAGNDALKPSAQRLQHLADRIVLFDAERQHFDIRLEYIDYRDGRWIIDAREGK
jgi:hypothetical protein